MYLRYTESSLYVGVVAYSNPENIRGQVRPRDQMEGDLNEDTIFLRFDPFQDARSVFILASNAYGSQLDLRARNAISDDERYDITFNALYETKSSINDEGYVVEFLIPFNSIPYPSGKDQEWGFNVMRVFTPVSYTHLRAHETPEHLVCRLLLEKKKKTKKKKKKNNITY